VLWKWGTDLWKREPLFREAFPDCVKGFSLSGDSLAVAENR
jgi:hypothetical protein